MQFLLPNHPSLLRIDRFDLLDSDAPEVRFWDLLQVILKDKATTTSTLIDHLETIAVTLRGASNTDYGFLRTFLDEYLPSKDRNRFFEIVWPTAVALALKMPDLFPDGFIAVLSEDNPQLVLSRRQTACLVVHQFLCSLAEQPWETDSSVDFHIWFGSEVACPRTVEAYLQALFCYFERFVGDGGENSDSAVLACAVEDWPITFTLRSLPEYEAQHLGDLYDKKLMLLTVVQIPEASADPSVLGIPRGACVISANKNVGFGSTGTQEETHVGSSPEACPAVLIIPTLKDTQVLIVQGPEAMISMKGYGRGARLDKVLKPDYDCANTAGSMWPRRTMLFMDALELDMFDSTGPLPDLLPGHVDREIRKAYTAFSSKPLEDESYTGIFTGLWGCGAFGGDWQVKTIIQWCAAAMGGVPLHFVCAEDKQYLFATNLQAFSQAGLERGWTIGDVMRVMLALNASSRNVFWQIASVLSSEIIQSPALLD